MRNLQQLQTSIKSINYNQNINTAPLSFFEKLASIRYQLDDLSRAELLKVSQAVISTKASTFFTNLKIA